MSVPSSFDAEEHLANRAWQILGLQMHSAGRSDRERARKFAEILKWLVDLCEAEDAGDDPYDLFAHMRPAPAPVDPDDLPFE